MKPEELLDSLDQVGEDLLAAADQNVLVRKRRPWIGAAAAAVLVLAVGLGGFLLLKQMLAGRSPALPGASDTALTPAPGGELPLLSVGSYADEAVRKLDDPARSLAVDRWTLETGAEALPVYRNPVRYPPVLGWSRWSEAELKAMVRDAAVRLGTAPPEEILPRHDVEKLYIESYEAQTALGLISVDLKGGITVFFNEEQRPTAEVKLDFAEELTEQDMEREYRDAVMVLCGEQVEAMLKLPKCHPAVCDDWSSLSGAYQSYLLYPVREDPAEQLLSRRYEAVRLLTADGTHVTALAWDRLPQPGAHSAVPPDFELLGTYPIISVEEARSMVLEGNYLCERGSLLAPAPESLELAELVYLPADSRDTLLPFYRFWVPDNWNIALYTGCTAVLVPAVDSAWLADFPRSKLPQSTTEPVSEATDPTETEPEPTQPPDGYQPMPAGRDADGTPRIAGPAGAVKALLYMGSELLDPVWADLDGDGFRELVYWCDGPTSGLFTAGLCVYGLEAGWPVLKAAQIYTLTWGELRLAEEGGRVLLHYTPQRFDPAAGSTVPQVEQILSVSLQDGELLLNGGALPEGCALWDGPEWSWYGRSFTEMNAIAREAATHSGIPRLPLYASACLVWPQVTGSSVPTAGQRVFAAVTENGVTVTGLLRWEPLQDGTYFCAMQGIEAIEAPKPAELLGLSAEALTERFGPRHFETDDPTPKLCWFTKDCRLLTVTMDGVAAEAGLQGLVELAEQTRGQAYTLKEGAVCFRQPGGERAVYSAERDGRYCLFFNWEDPETGMIYLNGFGGIEISVESWDALEAYPDALPLPDAPVP
ncbi:MAG: hypothetical protein II062_06610 [Oscillospiraceae bacterium]|nr:hypothetical protein [Oscillospiraceae bacterium]